MFINDFCNGLNEIKIIRNKSAHKSRILESDAIRTFNLMLKEIRFIDFLYKSFGFVFSLKNK